jgi:hypothetical protein
MNTMTQPQAEKRVEVYARNAAGSLPESSRLEVSDVGSGNCDDPTDNGPKGRVEPYVEYQVIGLDPNRYNEYFNDLKQWWERNNFHVLRDARPKRMFLWVQNNSDGFNMTVKSNDLGEMYLIATSTCVWPNGTPPPSVTG